jgi:hypothetical protein
MGKKEGINVLPPPFKALTEAHRRPFLKEGGGNP